MATDLGYVTYKVVTARKRYLCTTKGETCLKEINPKDQYASVTEWDENNFPRTEKVCLACHTKGK